MVTPGVVGQIDPVCPVVLKTNGQTPDSPKHFPMAGLAVEHWPQRGLDSRGATGGRPGGGCAATDLLRRDAVRRQAGRAGRLGRLRRRVRAAARAGDPRGRPRSAARRPGARRRADPQADVRAADPRRLRRRRPHDGERERLLRARRAPRRAAVLDRARQRRREARCRSTSRPTGCCRTRSTRTGRPAAPEDDRGALVTALRAARAATTDSPVFQLVDDLPTPQIDRLKTDVFREQAAYSAEVKAAHRRRARRRARTRCARSSATSARSRTSRPACSSTCSSRTGRSSRGRT